LFAAKLSPDGGTVRYRTYIAAPNPFVPAYATPPLLPSALAVDAAGNAYIAGATTGENFPGIDGTAKSIKTAGGSDAFLLKLDPNGRVIGSMLIGGKDSDAFTSMALSADGFLYLAGTTKSADFPVTAGAYRARYSEDATHAFVIKLKVPQNTVVFTALLGEVGGWISPLPEPVIGIDSSGSVHMAVSTKSPTWPASAGAVQPQYVESDAVLVKLSIAGDRLLYCTYLGGTGTDLATALAIDGAGHLYVAGTTTSSDLPVTTGAFQSRRPLASYPNILSAFVAKLNPDLTRLEYSTYLDGSLNDEADDIAVDPNGVAYVGGRTTSPDFPLHNAVQEGLHNARCPQYTLSGSIPVSYNFCGSSGFVTAINPQGSGLVWSTNMGRGRVAALALDGGQIYMGGESLDPMDPAPRAASVVRFDPVQVSLQFAPKAITNAASFHPGLPHPGGLASIFVEGLDLTGTVVSSALPPPRELAGVAIAVDGTDAPILAVADLGGGRQQINFQVPFEAKSNRVEVRYKSLSTFAFPETVGPGIFVLPTGEAAIQRSDYSLVTADNPARAGEVIIVYGTGFGPVQPPVATGDVAIEPAVLNPGCLPSQANLQTSLGRLGRIEYAGIAPGFPGLYQLNVRLPDVVPVGTTDFSVYFMGCWPIGSLPQNFLRSNVVALHLE
jgi:uncharacterized protein (TIGR03437 family)